MIIKKSHQNYTLISQIIVHIKKIKLRYYTVFLFLILLTTSVGIGGIYYGTQLFMSENHSVFGSFYRFFRPSINIIEHYFKGLLSQPEELSVHLKHIDYQRIAYGVENARERKLITNDDKDEVNGYLEYNGQKYEISIRLKGMILDHVRSDKWSFRIKLKDNKTIFGMEKFSLHSPETRSHIHEWVFQKALQYEDLISLRYKFVKINLNGKYLGIYALEEHFNKRLIENNNKREGIIVKPDMLRNRDGEQVNINATHVNISDYSLFVYQKGKVLSDTTLNNSYHHLSKRLQLFRKHKIPSRSIIDYESTSKYFALSTIFGAQHGHVPLNFVFYYNPVTDLIEPIGYDGNVARYLERYGGMITSPNNAYHNDIFVESGVTENLFNSKEFYTMYVHQLKRMTDDDYLINYFKKIDEELNKNLGFLYKEYPYFDFFKRDFYSANVNYIKKQLYNEKLVNAIFFNHDGLDRISLKIDNLKDISINVLGLELGRDMVYKTNNETIIKPTMLDEPPLVRFYAPLYSEPSVLFENELKLVYQVLGLDSIFKVDVDQVPFDYFKEHNLSENNYYKGSTINQYSFLDLDSLTNTIVVHSGKYKITGDLVIPKDYIFTLEPGVELDLLENGKIISYSTIQFLGTQKQPIIIHSSDSTGQGITLINAKGESIFKYVFFDNLCNLSMRGWEMTGAVNFYESDVRIFNCVFSNNFSEDALNIIRSEYEINNTSFSKIKSDAFDSDFSNGIISNSTFNYIGNDAVDISGSTLNINNIFIDGAGDKGISVGEKSLLDGSTLTIKNSAIGVTSKDLSEINLSKVNMSDLQVGFTAFQKKPEYGPGSIIITDLTINNMEIPFLIEEGSSMIYENKHIENVNGKVEDILYGNVFGKSSK